jgi:hypothetical protein
MGASGTDRGSWELGKKSATTSSAVELVVRRLALNGKCGLRLSMSTVIGLCQLRRAIKHLVAQVGERCVIWLVLVDVPVRF